MKVTKYITYKFDGQKYQTHELHVVKKWFYGFYQESDKNYTTFLDKFTTQADAIYQYRG